MKRTKCQSDGHEADNVLNVHEDDAYKRAQKSERERSNEYPHISRKRRDQPSDNLQETRGKEALERARHADSFSIYLPD